MGGVLSVRVGGLRSPRISSACGWVCCSIERLVFAMEDSSGRWARVGRDWEGRGYENE